MKTLLRVGSQVMTPTCDYIGKSTDTKPAAPNGSSFFEMDTGKIYFYDGATSSWIELEV